MKHRHHRYDITVPIIPEMTKLTSKRTSNRHSLKEKKVNKKLYKKKHKKEIKIQNCHHETLVDTSLSTKARGEKVTMTNPP